MAPEPSVEIRPENPTDGFTIETLTRTAFATHPMSDHTEQFIIAGLRKAGVLSISLVAILKEAIVGHIAFSPVTLSDGTAGWFGLGPLAVDPIHQGLGIGQALVKAGLDRLKNQGANGCVVVGAKAFYGRFGFTQHEGLKLEGVPPEYFIAMTHSENIPVGTVAYHAAFGAVE